MRQSCEPSAFTVFVLSRGNAFTMGPFDSFLQRVAVRWRFFCCQWTKLISSVCTSLSFRCSAGDLFVEDREREREPVAPLTSSGKAAVLCLLRSHTTRMHAVRCELAKSKKCSKRRTKDDFVNSSQTDKALARYFNHYDD